MTIETLTHELVDDICLIAGDIGAVLEELPALSVKDLGPIIELAHARPEIAKILLSSKILKPERLSVLISGLSDNNKSMHFINDPKSIGYMPVPQLAKDLGWAKFAILIKAATSAAGFSSNHGAEVVAAIGEFYSNVVEHSHAEETGYVAYCGDVGRFEFVVADKGMGVLQSLRQNPAFGDISDSGSAIELAISEGISSSMDLGRGQGFRPVFVGLANISEELRFRSGDHGHMMERDQARNIEARTIQMANLDGFFCSVVCTLRARSILA